MKVAELPSISGRINADLKSQFEIIAKQNRRSVSAELELAVANHVLQATLAIRRESQEQEAA